MIFLFYGTTFEVYMSSAVTDPATKIIVASVMYVVVPQMLNPLIYILRNREMKEVLSYLILRMPPSL
jgi:olfactory receptor